VNVRSAKNRGLIADLTRPGTAGNSAHLRGKLTLALKALMSVNGLALSGCETAGGNRDPEDVAPVTEDKRRPSPDTLTDSTADARYNGALEGWIDRLQAAGMRLCHFYEWAGMPKIPCPKD